MPVREPVTWGRVLGDAVAAPCVAALVIPIIAMVFDRWSPAYGSAAIWVLVTADVGWSVALFTAGLRRLREEESTTDVHFLQSPVPVEDNEPWNEVADDR